MTLSQRGPTAASAFILAQLCLSAQTVPDPTSTDLVSRSAPAYRPLTRSDRLNDFLKRTASPVSLVSSAASAGLGQWRDVPEEWGQGGAGFGRRYASSFAQHVVQETLMFGVSSALHEDNRYVRSRDSGTRQRIYNAMNGTFFARGDDGRKRFSCSRIGAFAGSALISRLWQPPSTDRIRGVPLNVGSSIGLNIGMNVVKEFWPRKRQP
jgi:hypothetical protein